MFASSGERGEPCGMPRRWSRASVVRVFRPRSSVSSTGHSSHILIRCSTRRTFTFLGFTFICGLSRCGNFQLQRKTRRDRMLGKLKDIKAELRRRMHQPIPEQGRWLRPVVTGHFAYYAVPTNSRALSAFRHHVTDLWRGTLRRRSQKDGFTWDRMKRLVNDWLPQPRILHPWPDVRLTSDTQGRSRMP